MATPLKYLNQTPNKQIGEPGGPIDTKTGSDGRPPWWHRVNWPTVGVIVGILSLVSAIFFGTALLLSARINDVNTNVNGTLNRVASSINDSLDRMEASVREDIDEVKEDVAEVRGDVRALSGDVGYIKGRLDRTDTEE